MAGLRFRSIGEQLELRLALTATTFVPHALPLDATQAREVEVGDVDSDGDLDLIVSHAGRTSLFENTDPANGTYEQRTIGEFDSHKLIFAEVNEQFSNSAELIAVRPGSPSGLVLVVFANTDDEGTFAVGKLELIGEAITSLPFSIVTDVVPVDFDGDGQQYELIVSGSDAITNTNVVWLRQASPLEFSRGPLQEGWNAVNPTLDVVDLNGDGELDVLSSHDVFLNIGWPGPGPDGPRSVMYWYEGVKPTIGKSRSFVEHVIPFDPIPGLNAGSEMRDMDRDSDLDFVRASFFPTAGTENGFTMTLGWLPNNNGEFGSEIAIDSFESPAGLRTDVKLLVEDFDGDSDADIVVGVDGIGIRAYSNNGQLNPEFSLTQTAFEGATVDSLTIDDFDGDQDMDLVGAVNGQVVWLENRLTGDIDFDGEVNFADFLQLSESFGQEVEPWTGGDLDGDGQVGFPDFLQLSANFDAKRVIENG